MSRHLTDRANSPSVSPSRLFSSAEVSTSSLMSPTPPEIAAIGTRQKSLTDPKALGTCGASLDCVIATNTARCALRSRTTASSASSSATPRVRTLYPVIAHVSLNRFS